MPTNFLNRILTQLEESKTRFGRGEAAKAERLLATLSRRVFTDTASLLRLHEAALFLRAFPHSPSVLRSAERILLSMPGRIGRLRARGADMSVFEDFDGSGVAGTTMQDTLGFDVARWLVRRLPGDVEIAWDEYDDERAMGEIWPRLLPLLEEDAYVEANIPWRQWLLSARGIGHDLQWLIRSFENLPIGERERAELYNQLRLPLRWKVNDFRFSRSGNWESPREIFYHREPLITRNQVHLLKELDRPSPKLKRLTRSRGEEVMTKIREVMAVRYRELYGTTLGDPNSVLRFDAARGVVMYLWNLPPDRRLPLRAYVAGCTLKNGVPINYIEAIGICEWMEVGFNTFYTFRNGETAWIYAQSLRFLLAMTGAKCISIYPYQIGQNNDEAIESGAFWFYRKLGFRPGRRDLLRLTESEEARIATRKGYRTSPRILKKLAESHVFLELPGSEPGAWDRFSARQIGFRVNQRMGSKFGGNSQRIRKKSVDSVARTLGIQPSRWNPIERQCLENWSLVLALIPDLNRWPASDKQDLVQIIRAQAGRDEMQYLRLTQKQQRLRKELLKLGSNRPSSQKNFRSF